MGEQKKKWKHYSKEEFKQIHVLSNVKITEKQDFAAIREVRIAELKKFWQLYKQRPHMMLYSGQSPAGGARERTTWIRIC